MVVPVRTAQGARDGQLAPDDLFADRYQVEALLGRGGMGAVYRVRDLSLSETIALKVLAFGPEPPPVSVLRFRQEVRLARRVTHPNVARVFDIGDHEGVIYMTMELIDGDTLRGALRASAKGHFDLVRAAQIAWAVCEGLASAHAAGIIHRDLKPANVLLERGGRVVLSDFGIARSLNEDMSLTMGVLGTPHYMAPEQASSGVIDARTDIYAVGILLHEMLTGAHPDSPPDQMAAELQVTGAPPELIKIIQSCLERDPASRPHRAEDVARLIARAVPEAQIEYQDTQPQALSSYASSTAPRIPSDAAVSAPVSFAEVEPADRGLAVLPFRYRGPPERRYLGDVITDELIDVLSRTRGLRVLGTGATEKYRDARDPKVIGRELSALAVVDGSLHMSGDQMRVTVRLIDAESAVQLWSDHYEGDLGEVVKMREAIAQRVAEELRVELAVRAHSVGAPSEAIDRYLITRKRLRGIDYASLSRATADLASCIELAPRFAPAYAAHALACVKSWYFNIGQDAARNWEREAEVSVKIALMRAAELAETHLASALLAVSRGDYPAAAGSFARALSIAPTFAEAHEYLGALQCEAGQADAGATRLELADQLDPTLLLPLPYIARHHALHGRFEPAEAVLTELNRRRGKGYPLASFMRLRIAAWRGDHEGLRHGLAEHMENETPNAWQQVPLYARAHLGELDDSEIERSFARLNADAQNARQIGTMMQLQTEIYAGRGNVAAALLHVLRAADSTLIDIEWLNRCPLLAPLRKQPDFSEACRRVRGRAMTFWTP